ncbi:MAG: ANTAR domain-containing protein [Lachnospiraceae bacterium]|nr:ANTAR domain-containing protein [Lachnospiraceae bacterium]
MSEFMDRQCNVLIVSSSEKMNNFISKVLPGQIHGALEIRQSASTARRELLEREYDVIMINIPLPDETATDLAIDLSSSCSCAIILVAPADISEDISERVTDYGIAVIAKPVNAKSVSRSIRLMSAIRDKYKKVEKKAQSLEDKMEEIRLVNRAKLILIEKKGMSEDAAHRFIGKAAMDRGLTKRAVAEEIIEEGNNEETGNRNRSAG